MYIELSNVYKTEKKTKVSLHNTTQRQLMMIIINGK